MCQDAAEQRTAGAGGEVQRGATLQEGLGHLLAFQEQRREISQQEQGQVSCKKGREERNDLDTL